MTKMIVVVEIILMSMMFKEITKKLPVSAPVSQEQYKEHGLLPVNDFDGIYYNNWRSFSNHPPLTGFPIVLYVPLVASRSKSRTASSICPELGLD